MIPLPESLIRTLSERGLDPDLVVRIVNTCLDEDLRDGTDITTDSLFTDAIGQADIRTRQRGCLAGVPVAAAVLHGLAYRTGTEVEFTTRLDDAKRVCPGDTVATVSGPVRTLLVAERTMLNLLSHLSGVATSTSQWVDALAATTTRIRDTRKTVPGLRDLDKYAVRCGGGVNHRMGLSDAALIKDNHISAAGSLTAAVDAVRSHQPDAICEVECDTVDQVREAVNAGVQTILLDNMDNAQMTEAVSICHPRGVVTEASGGLTLDHAKEIAKTGVDYVAVGAITHSAPILDLGLDFD
ncbi:carboxylating nicotinate-nucleotide diphosphorylase [Cutibacterium sp. WCA-380-WT-3A]|uniref:Nicotinate-nucleotide pyrophosphorylase [carboxylating] n=1 Tax=Cutibacterium porci TaxID=2605781 RepID=A0A7K0J6X2_9ACTN|nr:carboxylating nicotinate-nucleotide diphosphorylase [Cutibacterium porci]MSS45697.1 carboxylating nicotinate-nucleotide diphosphorylase [Cutibacterium porci]